MLVFSCAPPENPLLTDFDTPYNVPPFDKIEEEHFMPAFEEAMNQHNREIEEITTNPGDPTFENTLEAYDKSGYLLSEVNNVFRNLNSSHTNDKLQEIAREITPKLSSHYDNILLDRELFERIEHVYDRKGELDLNDEQQMLLDKVYRNFIRAGAALPDDEQERLKEINERISSLTLDFGDNVREETNDFELVIEDPEDLSGLPEGVAESAAEEAEERGYEDKWVFTLHNPSVMPFLHYADNREMREKIKKAYINRGNNDNEYDNKEIIEELVSLRLERAGMLGYNTHADYVLEENMAENPGNVYEFLDEIWEAALPIAKQEAYDLQKMIYEEGHDFNLQPWDWRYYAEKVRKERFDFDEEELRPYLSMEKVIDGAFMVVNKLWGLEFEKVEEIPRYHEDVEVYEVLDADGSHLGILYMDNYNRPTKRGGAWMSSFREQWVKDGEFVYPVITINCNFSRPTADTPSLLTFDEYTTFFHELGHALHGLMSNCTYRSLSGTSVPRDFVELPSQIMENWAKHPDVITMFAEHYETGEVIPDDMLKRLEESQQFNQGFATVEYLATSFLDMDYHTLSEPFEELDPITFEEESMDDIGLIPEIVPRWRSTYLNHIFSGGYSAGYYSYIWSGLLDADAFEAFKETDLFDRQTAQRFREEILERGGTREPMEMYVNFRGHEPDIEPLLRQRGLIR